MLLGGEFWELELRFLIPVLGRGQRPRTRHVRVTPRTDVHEHVVRRHRVHLAHPRLVSGTKNEVAVGGRAIVTARGGRISRDGLFKRVRSRDSDEGQEECYKFQKNAILNGVRRFAVSARANRSVEVFLSRPIVEKLFFFFFRYLVVAPSETCTAVFTIFFVFFFSRLEDVGEKCDEIYIFLILSGGEKNFRDKFCVCLLNACEELMREGSRVTSADSED